jgi:hypothetical protein
VRIKPFWKLLFVKRFGIDVVWRWKLAGRVGVIESDDTHDPMLRVPEVDLPALYWPDEALEEAA